MSFSEILDLESSALKKESVLSSLEESALRKYVEYENRKNTAKDFPFEYFYEDVISGALRFKFKPVIGERNYKNAEKDALACLEISIEMWKLSPYSVPLWIQSALKFVDYLVLYYIQEYRKDTPRKYHKAGVEKSRYIQLSEYSDNEIKVAGNELAELYKMRNGFEHRTIIHEDGTQELVKPNFNKLKKKGTKLYSNALKRILKEYKNIYPKYIENI